MLLCIVCLALGAGMATAAPSDAGIAAAIETQYQIDPVVDANRIDVRVSDGVVELSGDTRNLLARQRAARIAAQVRGVRSVSNRIEVEPSVLVTDAGIARSVRDALAEDPAIEAAEIRVSVQGNVVTLHGEVDSLAEKELAGTLAKRVRGVVAVSNGLRVDLTGVRPDDEIAADIHQRLRWDILVDHALIEVGVDDGRVRLAGTVGSLAEKRQARRDSRVRGVHSVDASQLTVDPEAGRAALRGDKYAAKGDAEVAAAVEDALRVDPRVAADSLSAGMDEGGMLILRGQVDNFRAKQVAGSLARHTVGVRDVANLIKVRPRFRPTDVEMERMVRARLRRHPLITETAIDVHANNGQVVLRGRVDSRAESTEAEREAASVAGVSEVLNNLFVAGRVPPPGRGPYDLSGSPPLELPAERRRSDAQIAAAILYQMRWSPFVDPSRIDVSVTDGVAQLEGSVANWREYQAAEDQAWEGGAVAVRNRLTVL
jgi:osmotically-inducible protein OsmY